MDFNLDNTRFALDNLLFDFAPAGGAGPAVPLPAAVWMGASLAGWIGLKRRR
jgi:hypothetical protein